MAWEEPRTAVMKNGTLVGLRSRLNLVEGTNVTLTVTDNEGDDRVNVTVQAEGGEAGGASGNSPSRFCYHTDQDTQGSTLATQQAIWVRALCRASIVLDRVTFWVHSAGDDIRLRVLRVTGERGNSTVAEVVHETSYESVSAPAQHDFSGLALALAADTIYAFVCEVETGSGLSLRRYEGTLADASFPGGQEPLLGVGRCSSGSCSRNVAVSGTLTEYSGSVATAELAWT